jgi:lipopolysaccharide transport system ATP-binding protein
MEPDVILADEILAVGDIAFQERCFQRIEEVRDAGTSVLFVSHDMNAVRRICERVIWLDGGRIVADGSADDVVERYEASVWTDVTSDANSDASCVYGRLVSVRLLNTDGREVGSVDASEAATIALGIETFPPNIELRCALGVDAHGVRAFQSEQVESVRAEAPGFYEVQCTIPPHTLADIMYIVSARVSFSRQDTTKVVRRRSALAFRAISPNALVSGDIRGVVNPALEWSSASARISS